MKGSYKFSLQVHSYPLYLTKFGHFFENTQNEIKNINILSISTRKYEN